MDLQSSCDPSNTRCATAVLVLQDMANGYCPPGASGGQQGYNNRGSRVQGNEHVIDADFSKCTPGTGPRNFTPRVELLFGTNVFVIGPAGSQPAEAVVNFTKN